MRNPTEQKSRMEKAANGSRPRDAGKIIRRLWKYLAGYKYLFMLAVLLVLVSNIVALFGPEITGKAIGAIGDNEGEVDFPLVFKYISYLVVIYVFAALVGYLQSMLMIHITQKITVRMRNDLFARLSRLRVSYFDRRQAGDILSVLTYDVNTVNESLALDFIQIVTSAVTIIGSLVMMLRIKPILVLVFAVTIPISICFTKFITKRVRPLFRARSAKLGELNGFVEEMTAGCRTIRAYSRENEIVSDFDFKNDEAVDAYTKSEYYGTVTGPGVMFINNLSLSFVSIFGSILYMFGKIKLEGLSSFVLYSRKFSGPINEIANIYSEIQSALAAGERVFRLIDEEEEPADVEDAVKFERLSDRVDFDRVTFGYDPEKIIIRDLSFSAPKGKMIAIVGHTGAGKTTIINLLMRFYDANSGDIRFDGKEIKEFERDSIRRAYTMVLQDTWLFRGTVYENIAYGAGDVTMEQVVEAAKAAKIHSFITKLPEGYNTVLTDDGINISKGQKQLLTIARAMLVGSEMLILDEATSNVDTRTEQAIQAAMRVLMEGKTCFVIAHRLSTVRDADEILVMDGGVIVERGTHDELIALGGSYRELYYSQFDSGESVS